jgi:hypothetical protein
MFIIAWKKPQKYALQVINALVMVLFFPQNFFPPEERQFCRRERAEKTEESK